MHFKESVCLHLWLKHPSWTAGSLKMKALWSPKHRKVLTEWHGATSRKIRSSARQLWEPQISHSESPSPKNKFKTWGTLLQKLTCWVSYIMELQHYQRLNILIFEFFCWAISFLKWYPRVKSCWEFSLTASAVKTAFHPTKQRKLVQLFEGRSVKYRILILWNPHMSHRKCKAPVKKGWPKLPISQTKINTTYMLIFFMAEAFIHVF